MTHASKIILFLSLTLGGCAPGFWQRDVAIQTKYRYVFDEERKADRYERWLRKNRPGLFQTDIASAGWSAPGFFTDPVAAGSGLADLLLLHDSGLPADPVIAGDSSTLDGGVFKDLGCDSVVSFRSGGRISWNASDSDHALNIAPDTVEQKGFEVVSCDPETVSRVDTVFVHVNENPGRITTFGHPWPWVLAALCLSLGFVAGYHVKRRRDGYKTDRNV